MALQLSPEVVIAALTETRGLVAAAARRLKCTRQTLYNYRDQYPEVAEAMIEAREFTTDTAELSLFNAIQKGEPWAVCFYLKTQGKGRGYVERQEHTGPEGKPIEIITVEAVRPTFTRPDGDNT